MRLYLSWRRLDLVDVEVKTERRKLLDVRLHLLTLRPEPAPAPAPAPESKDDGPGFHRGSSLADSSRAGWTPQPDTTTFGFNRRRR